MGGFDQTAAAATTTATMMRQMRALDRACPRWSYHITAVAVMIAAVDNNIADLIEISAELYVGEGKAEMYEGSCVFVAAGAASGLRRRRSASEASVISGEAEAFGNAFAAWWRRRHASRNAGNVALGEAPEETAVAAAAAGGVSGGGEEEQPITSKQRRMIHAVAYRLRIDAREECFKLLGERISRLSVPEASRLIEHLKDLERREV